MPGSRTHIDGIDPTRVKKTGTKLMAEIKSTLDLVMEKTRHLTLTEDERDKQEKYALAQKINGLLQRYLDGSLPLESFKRRIGEFGNEHGTRVKEAAAKEILNRVALATDNEAMLLLLSSLFNIDCQNIGQILAGYEHNRQAKEQLRMAELKQHLATTQSIQGSAVIPNLDLDAVWRERVEMLRELFDPKLTIEKNRIEARL
jgi:anti-anti-sigma regulatory factor